MQTVTLIGDSIRMGYQEVVGRLLAGRAKVWGPVENGGTSANALDNLDQWVIARPANIVHINCGTHDLNRNKPFDRFEADVVAYNAAAAEVAGELGVPVNDLFSLVTQKGRDTLLMPDGVHFTQAGYEFLGEKVASFIINQCAKPGRSTTPSHRPSPLPPPT